MEKKDLPEVLEIEWLSFPNPWTEMAFRGEIDNAGISFPLVAVSQGEERIIGYLSYWQIKSEVQISTFAVHPQFRRGGVGESLMRYVLERVRSAGAERVFLEVRPSNLSASALYQKLGFKILGTRKGYYRNPPEDAIVMAKSL